MIDGCSRIGFFWRILLPLSAPALTTVGILAFVGSWNGYLLPLLVLSDPSQFTLPLGTATFSSQYSSDTAKILAFTALSMFPGWPSSNWPSDASSVGSPARSRAERFGHGMMGERGLSGCCSLLDLRTGGSGTCFAATTSASATVTVPRRVSMSHAPSSQDRRYPSASVNPPGIR
jgi:hypothetical protein